MGCRGRELRNAPGTYVWPYICSGIPSVDREKFVTRQPLSRAAHTRSWRQLCPVRYYRCMYGHTYVFCRLGPSGPRAAPFHVLRGVQALGPEPLPVSNSGMYVWPYICSGVPSVDREQLVTRQPLSRAAHTRSGRQLYPVRYYRCMYGHTYVFCRVGPSGPRAAPFHVLRGLQALGPEPSPGSNSGMYVCPYMCSKVRNGDLAQFDMCKPTSSAAHERSEGDRSPE